MRSLLLVLLLLCRVAVADEPTAASLLADASRLFTEEADLEGALQQFQAAYKIEPSWRALNGIALVYQQQGRYIEALETYEQLMATFSAELSDKQRTTVQERLRSLDASIGAIELHVGPAGAAVLVDGRERTCTGGSCTTRVLPGAHTIVVTHAGYYARTQKATVVAGAHVRVDVQLLAETERIRVVTAAPKTRYVRRFPRSLPWLLLGGGAIVLGIGGALSGAAADDFSRFDSQVGTAAGTPPKAVMVDPSLLDRGRILSDVSYALFAVGGLAVVGGSAFALVNRPQLVVETGAIAKP